MTQLENLDSAVGIDSHYILDCFFHIFPVLYLVRVVEHRLHWDFDTLWEIDTIFRYNGTTRKLEFTVFSPEYTSNRLQNFKCRM